jgi:hypothetical protein|tara:strand:+ start:137 stop:343 length:207 start_codon:yes stop_codon:yes gene_type:complete
LSENYYSRGRVYDKEGNFLHMDTRESNSSIVREGYFFTDIEQQLNEEYRYYEEQKEKEQELKSNQKGG